MQSTWKVKKILIIEDDLVLSDMYKLKLEKEGFEVKQATDWLKWLVVLENYTPDVVLLDIMMPSMDWFETLKAIKNQTSCHSKIVMFTNVIDKDKIVKAKKYWADDYIIKSDTNPSDIVKRLNKIINNAKKDDENVFYLKPGKNKLKMKNPFIEGWDDIGICINIKV